MIFTNLLTDANEQGAGFEYLPNSRMIGNIKVVTGRYYLVSFSLKTSLQIMPVLMSVNSEPGLTLNLIEKTIINTTTELGPNNKIYSSTGVYLYGGICTEDNNSWSSVVTFGRCGFSSFACSIDEVNDVNVSVAQSTISQNNSTNLIDANYMVGMSTLQNQGYPMKIVGNLWTMLSDSFDESIVPNLITAWSTGDSNQEWIQLTATGQPGPYLETASIACKLTHS